MKLLWQGEAEIICALVQRPYWFFHLPGHLSFLRAQWNALLCGLGSTRPPTPSSGSDLEVTFVLQASGPPPSTHTPPAVEHSVTVAQSQFMSSLPVPETAT